MFVIEIFGVITQAELYYLHLVVTILIVKKLKIELRKLKGSLGFGIQTYFLIFMWVSSITLQQATV